MSTQCALGVLLFLVLVVNSLSFEFYVVTRSYSSRSFLCTLDILYTLMHTDSTDQVPPSNQVRLEQFEMKTNDAYMTTGVDIATTENVTYMTADNTISAPQDVTYEQVLPRADAVCIGNEAYTTADNTISAQDVTYEQILPQDDGDINEYDYVINDEP